MYCASREYTGGLCLFQVDCCNARRETYARFGNLKEFAPCVATVCSTCCGLYGGMNDWYVAVLAQ